MSAYLTSWFGRIGRIWPVEMGGRSYVWVEEDTASGAEYAVLHHYFRGLWYRAEGFVLQDPALHDIEVEPVYGEIDKVGYPYNQHGAALLVIEQDDRFRYWLLYLRENDSWVVTQEFRVQLYVLEDDSMEGESLNDRSDIADDE